MKFELNEQERNRIIELFDLATKAGGLMVAKDALILAQKLSNPIDKIADEPAKQDKKS